MAGEERFLSNQLNAVIDIDGVVGYLESCKKSGGDAEDKKIGINGNGYVMNQPGEKKPIQYDVVLMVPQANVATYMATYKNEKILTSFRSGLDDPAELAKAGQMKIATADWDAAILDNNILKVNLKLVTMGFGSGTTYGALIATGSGVSGGGSGT